MANKKIAEKTEQEVFEEAMKKQGLITLPYDFRQHLNYEKETTEYSERATYLAFEAWKLHKKETALTHFCANDVKTLIANYPEKTPAEILKILIN